jgi:hypothetical protein
MKNILFTVLFLVIFVNGYCQQNTQQGIFDMPNKVTATSKSTIRETDGLGESIYQSEKLPNGNYIVQYLHTKPFPNPQVISYTFGIKALSADAFAIDIEAAMHPSALYLDTTIVKTSYIGDKVILPNKPASDNPLDNVKGVYTIRKIADNDILVRYEISLTNRKLSAPKNIFLNEKGYQMYKHSYDYFQRSISKDKQTIAEYHETVEDTYLVGHGLVNQTRKDRARAAVHQENNRTIISELLKVN